MADQAGQERPGAVRLSADDRLRMARLYEEVAGRVMEMSLIVARTLGEDSKYARELTFVRQLRPPETDQEGVRDAAAARGGVVFQGTEIIHFSGCQYGCYDHDGGICFPC
jgi:hypothetical protein